MIKNKIAYTEVFEVLSYMNKEVVIKIPYTILSTIKDNRDLNYISRIDKNDIFNPENLSEKAIAILAWLDLKYLASEESKKKKIKLYQENERKYQENLHNKYNPDDILKNRNRITQEKIKASEETRITIVEEENWYQKIFNLIKNLFKRG